MIDDRRIYITSKNFEYKNNQKYLLQLRNKNPLVKMIHYENLGIIKNVRNFFLKFALRFVVSFHYEKQKKNRISLFTNMGPFHEKLVSITNVEIFIQKTTLHENNN